MENGSYTYPAIFKYYTSGVEIVFPDLENCYTFCDKEEEAVKRAKELLGQYVYNCDKENLPIPGDVRKIKFKKNEVVVIIEVWLPYYIATLKKHSVKKTLTIPNWLNEVAEHNHINFSKVLQEALKEKLELGEMEKIIGK